MMSKKLPKDLGVKIGSKKEVFWTNVRDAAKNAKEEAENSIMLQSAVIEMAEKNIQKEKDLNSS